MDKSIIAKRCSVEDCTNKFYGRGLCNKHYQYKRWHNPNFVKREKHGQTPKYLYDLWVNMRVRVNTPSKPGYKYWGGRGIKIAPEWANSFITFKEYVLTNLGERPSGHTFDRINNDGNYEPGNVRWATQSQQSNNRRKRGSCV
jgi:hypothetical protein